MWQTDKDEFVRGYTAAMLWANTYADRDGELVSVGETDLTPTLDDFSEDAERQVREDCEEFLSYDLDDCLVSDLISSLERIYGYTFEQAGHDFALTRNGHGAGFWDRGLGVSGGTLTYAAHTFGESSLLVDVDGVHSL